MDKHDQIEPSSLINNGDFLNVNYNVPTPLSDKQLIEICDAAKTDYLIMINDVHILLENCKDLSNEQKLEYCNTERNYMKEYLKYALIKINKSTP